MKFTLKEDGEVLVIQLTDFTSADEDGNLMSERNSLWLAIQEAGKNRVVVDLNELEYATSSLLALLVYLFKQCRITRRQFLLAAPSAACLKILQLTGLDRVFTVTVTVDEAVSAAV